MPTPTGKIAITPGSLAARTSRFAPHTLAAITTAFGDDGQIAGGRALTNPATGQTIRLVPAGAQIAYTREGQPLRHLPLSMDDALRWAAVDFLEDFEAAKAQVAATSQFLVRATDAVLVRR